jgi:hypothetical protein
MKTNTTPFSLAEIMLGTIPSLLPVRVGKNNRPHIMPTVTNCAFLLLKSAICDRLGIFFHVDDLHYFIVPVRRGNQYHKISAAGLLCTEVDLSCKATGG